MAKRTSQEIISDAEDNLYCARLGLEWVNDSDHRKIFAGIRNIVVFGRAITAVLIHLKTCDAELYETWFAGHEENMEKYPIMAFFTGIRNKVLHVGSPKVISIGVNIQIGNHTFRHDQSPEAYSGILERVLKIKADHFLNIKDIPKEYLNTPILKLCTDYLNFLESIIVDAKKTFK